MTLTYDQLINDARDNLGRAGGDLDRDLSGRLIQKSMAVSLIAIAQELHQINERAEIEIERQEMIQERKERTKEIW